MIAIPALADVVVFPIAGMMIAVPTQGGAAQAAVAVTVIGTSEVDPAK